MLTLVNFDIYIFHEHLKIIKVILRLIKIKKLTLFHFGSHYSPWNHVISNDTQKSINHLYQGPFTNSVHYEQS